ncbi:caspase family protein [Paenibacillus sp. FSL H8-0332]|uniref:caspase family protein n=1 Tax=Paenibacillus sp. FSL H8-0332 TaxID=2954742 RepID=UPI0030CAED62
MAYKAFLVAVDKNASPDFSSLPNTLNDVSEVKRLLMERPSNFFDDNVQEFTGTIAKKSIVETELRAFFESATSEDILFLFWAGHGYLHEGVGYLVPFDGDTAITDTSMIRMAELKDMIDNSKAKAIISLLDTCHSGSITRSKDILRGLQITGTGKVVIAACQAHQYAYDRNGHGAFSDYLIQGLSGAAANLEGKIDIYTLYSFISSKLTAEFQSGVQVPAICSSTLDGQPIEIKRIILRSDVENQAPKSDEETIMDNSGTSYWLGNISSEHNGFSELRTGVYKLNIKNPVPEVENEFRKINDQKTVVVFAIRNQAYLVKIENITISSTSSDDVMEVELKKVEGKHETASMEMQYGGGSGRKFTSDQIATIRAERILFGDEKDRTSFLGDMFLESLINSPINGSLKVVPNIISSLQNEGYSISRIRVMTVGYLILTGTVERIEKLNFKIKDGTITEVFFTGYRTKQYSNVDPSRIELNGQIR